MLTRSLLLLGALLGNIARFTAFEVRLSETMSE